MDQPVDAIRAIDLKTASQAEYAALNQHLNQIRREQFPDDPPIPLDERIGNFQNIPAFMEARLWSLWDPEGREITAQANAAISRTQDNPHLLQFEITVLPSRRRRGLALRLLPKVTEFAQQERRRLMMTETVDRLPAGEAFMNQLQAEKGLETHTNQLHLPDLGPGLLSAWLLQGQARAGQFELGFWEGSYPDDRLSSMAELYDLNNQQPFGDLEIKAQNFTPEQLRQSEQNLFARGYQRSTGYVVERASGAIAGYTETLWNPHRPEVLRQEMTGVLPPYRNKGLGRWLKAAMLERALLLHPQIKFVRTGNADSNAAMLKINRELGFKPYNANTIWQVETGKVRQYLRSHSN